jgi:hypothetical protein
MFLFGQCKTIVMDSPTEFDILPPQKRQIRESLLEPNMKKKYRSPADFVKSSIEILLAWESEHPEECMDILKTLKPFSSEQELFMKQSMKPEEIVKHFGSLDLDLHGEEEAGQKELAQTDFDHMKVIGNYLKSEWSYVKKIETLKPENVINYDGFPLLSINYNRFLPIKFTMLMLAHMLQSKKESKIELKELRVNAYDYLEEYGTLIREYEKINSVTRQNKISTGLPKKYDKDDDGKTEQQIRVKDIQIGKIRVSRKLGRKHFEGALSALGLVYVFEENNEVYLSLSELGKKFVLLENSIFPNNDYSMGALSDEESEFILNEIIPKRELENQIVNKILSSLKGVKKYPRNVAKKKLNEIETNIHSVIKEYIKQHPKESELFNISELESNGTKIKSKIKQRRLAIMGRLIELGKINWIINEDSISEYYLK